MQIQPQNIAIPHHLSTWQLIWRKTEHIDQFLYNQWLHLISQSVSRFFLHMQTFFHRKDQREGLLSVNCHAFSFLSGSYRFVYSVFVCHLHPTVYSSNPISPSTVSSWQWVSALVCPARLTGHTRVIQLLPWVDFSYDSHPLKYQFIWCSHWIFFVVEA